MKTVEYDLGVIQVPFTEYKLKHTISFEVSDNSITIYEKFNEEQFYLSKHELKTKFPHIFERFKEEHEKNVFLKESSKENNL